MAFFRRKDGKSLFGKEKTADKKKPERHELVDIPINSIIELSDITTYEETGDTSHAFKLVLAKKYVGDGLLRYMYHIQDVESELVVGVDHIAGTKDEYEISRWIIDGEQDLSDPLPDTMTLYYPPPDDEDQEIAVEFTRHEVIAATLTVTSPQGQPEEFTIELHEYATEEEELMCIEVCGTWLTFYVGTLITRSDIEIYPAMNTGTKDGESYPNANL